jgi:UDP-4-amino-4,6-dideoxy-N-acetyl-beta-L-altrosamine transaminase
MIPYGKQDIDQADIDSVIDVLQSDFLTQGPQVPLFESKISEYCGAEFSVAVNSATSALHIACLALGLGKGDYFWTSPNSFVASANCGLYCGAKVDFVDIDPETYNLSVEELERKLIQARQDNKLPKILIPVHFAGQSCDMKRIYSLSQEYGFKIIEDAAHAIGGKYLGRPIGACEYSDITVFSFHPVKIITTGEGGCALTNQSGLARKMRLLSSHGITREESSMNKKPEGPWYYQQIDLGFNYRMTELQAALGGSQLSRLDSFLLRRELLAKRYYELLAHLPVFLPNRSATIKSSWHLFIVRLDQSCTHQTRLEVFKSMRQAGIGVNVHYIPVYYQPYYEELGFRKGHCPAAEDYYSSAISLPLYPGLKDEEQRAVVTALELALN